MIAGVVIAGSGAAPTSREYGPQPCLAVCICPGPCAQLGKDEPKAECVFVGGGRLEGDGGQPQGTAAAGGPCRGEAQTQGPDTLEPSRSRDEPTSAPSHSGLWECRCLWGQEPGPCLRGCFSSLRHRGELQGLCTHKGSTDSRVLGQR